MIEKKEMLIAVGVTVGAAVLVLFMRKPASGGGGGGTGGEDIVGGFATAATVYVPTTAYNMTYNQYKGSVSYSTVDNHPTTTYSGGGAPKPPSKPPTFPPPRPGQLPPGKPIHVPTPPHKPPVIHYPPPHPHPPVITSPGGKKTNPPTKQTGTKPKAPAAHAPAPKHHEVAQKQIGKVHYATPKGGWDSHSLTDYVKEHGGDASLKGREKLAAANGITNYKGTEAQNQSLLSKLKSKYGAK